MNGSMQSAPAYKPPRRCPAGRAVPAPARRPRPDGLLASGSVGVQSL